MGPSAIPLCFPRMNDMKGKAISVLAGDVGGTKTNLAGYTMLAGELKQVAIASYPSAKFSACVDVIRQFLLENEAIKPDRICLGVAGPVVQGKAEITNLPWNLDAQDIRQATQVEEVALINDLEATAYGLAGLGAQDLLTIHEGVADFSSNMAIIAPGTGLGEAGLFWDGQAYHPFPTEGGHTDFAPRLELDVRLHGFLQKKYGVVSWEKVISGPAIHDMYQFLLSEEKASEPAWLTEQLLGPDPSAVISRAALDGKDGVCSRTMQLFIRYLARESSNLVLKMKATSGLFLAGGIPPKISALFADNAFFENFLDCDRMQHLITRTPVRIILNDKAPLIGAAWYGAYAVSAT